MKIAEENDVRNVLIISQYFAPHNVIAAIRFTKMVKYLAKTGKYHFWIITRKREDDELTDELLQRDMDEVEKYITVRTVDMDKRLLKHIKRFVHNRNEKEDTNTVAGEKSTEDNTYFIIQEKFVACREKGLKGAIKRSIGKIALFANDVYDWAGEIAFLIRGERLLKELPLEDMSAMISTYGKMGAHLLGLKVKAKNSKIKWIADYRDPITAASKSMQNYMFYLSKKVDRQATYITGVTPSCKGSGLYMDKFHVICNGFDRDDIRGIVKSNTSQKLTIVYTGSLYYGKREMTQLFRIIAELEHEKLIDSKKICIQYAGKHISLLEKQARKYNLESIIDYRGVVSRQEAIQMQYDADILCALTWNNIGNDNILTGKILEYFMMEKPIFAIVTGDKPGSSMAKIIREANAGFCLEEINLEREYDNAKKWVLKKYQEFISQGFLPYNSKDEILQKYSSQVMARKFGEII